MSALEELMGWVNQPVPENNQSPLELLLSNPDAFSAAANRQKRAVSGQQADPLLGFKVRKELYPSENTYFEGNPNVAGMASESGHVVLNPYSPPGVNHDAVARNEAMRLHMMKGGVTPQFELTPDQQKYYSGTSYGSDPNAARQTTAARIYSGDPSVSGTPEQSSWVQDYIRKANGPR